ncbi:MAG: type III pantothenate kinase [Acidobacteria bacterium]|nr:MAG: type III pantothenate kinase [Acidobacteriota bacterium]
MLLAIDVGNTHVVIGLFDGERLLRSWRISSRREMTADELLVLFAGLLGEHVDGIDDAVVGSVVPPLTASLVEALHALTGSSPLEVAPGVRTGLRIRADNPQEVGADRILNAVAAHARHSGPVIIVDFGTATTLDVVTPDAEYLGGIITPGPRLGAEALSLRAARLPRVDLSVPARVVGRNSVDAIRSGLLHGHAAMVDGLVRRIEAEVGPARTVVVTGGLADVIAPLMERVDANEPDLTLEGLRLVHARNRG